MVRRALHDRFPGRETVFTDSGTSALALAIRLCGGGRGRPVALPAYGCYDLATAADAAGVPVVLYDVEPSTLSPVEASLRNALERGAQTIVVVHLYGIPIELAMVRELATAFGALVIDDAAQGVGATYEGRPLGMHGALGILSFGRGKGMTGGGGGALLVPSDSPLGADARALALAPASGSAWRPGVMAAAQWALARPSLYGLPAALPSLGLGETLYQSPHPATTISAFAIGVLSVTMTLTDDELRARQIVAAALRLMVQGKHVRGVEPPSCAVAGYLRFPVRVSEAARSSVPAARRLGVMPGYPTSLASLAGFASRALNAGTAMPGAEELARTLCTLPTHGALRAADLARLQRWVADLPA